MVEKSFRMVLVGNSKVGKTSLLIRYKNDTFMDPDFVLYQGISTDIKDGRRIYRVHLVDTIGGDHQMKLRQYHYPQTGVFILCFAINDEESYINLKSQWIPEIKPFVLNTPLILVGTKSDLKIERRINLKQARKLQKECNAAFYIECSAKDGSGVNDVIRTALRAYKRTIKRRKGVKCVII